jgi:hypothetical protein
MKPRAISLLPLLFASLASAGEPSVFYLQCDYPTVFYPETGKSAKFAVRSYRISIDEKGQTVIENPAGSCTPLSGFSTASLIEGTCEHAADGRKEKSFRQVVAINRLDGSIRDHRTRGGESFTMLGRCQKTNPLF